jgi:transcriptional regulator with XRE-family HTH domain
MAIERIQQSSCTVIDHVRKNLSRIRREQRISARELAQKIGIPRTTYVSFESGDAGLSVDRLYDVLAALNVDISDVCPADADLNSRLRSTSSGRIQRFRLCEIVYLADAEGAALLRSSSDHRCSLLMATQMSEYFLDRIILHLENGVRYRPGAWFDAQCASDTLHLYLKLAELPGQLRPVAIKYMESWKTFFADHKATMSIGGRADPCPSIIPDLLK